MAKKYQSAIFQPTIRPSWAGSFEYIQTEELAKILKAITTFPNTDVPDSAFWTQTVKPDLEQQYQNFNNTCEKRGRGARTYWGEHKLSISSPYDNHKNNISITQGNLCKDKDKDKNKDKDNIKNTNDIIIKTYGENKKVRLTDEQYAKLQELYGRRLENAIQILDGYLAESTKNEKKYTNHYAVMRRNNWVYNKTFDGDFVPLKPQIADMSNFVRAKPLGEEE